MNNAVVIVVEVVAEVVVMVLATAVRGEKGGVIQAEVTVMVGIVKVVAIVVVVETSVFPLFKDIFSAALSQLHSLTAL